MPSSKALLLLFFTLFFVQVSSSSSSTAPPPTLSPPPPAGVVGVTYTVNTPGLPKPKHVAAALMVTGVPHVRLIESDANGIAAFADSGIDLLVWLNNTMLPYLASNESAALKWLSDNIVPSYPGAGVSALSVGNDVLTSYPELSDFILPALQNLHSACARLNLSRIPVSTVHNFDIVTPAFPPSASQFQKSVSESYVKPLLSFLNATKSPFQIDLYPFNLYRANGFQGITSGLATFEARESDYLVDPATGFVYRNLFDTMVDAAISAMAKLGYEHIPVVVTGTGWPSSGGSNEPDASLLFAGEYNERLVSHLNRWPGTPMRPGETSPTYIYGLFDEPRMKGAESERNWGIWSNDLSVKYVIDFKPPAIGGGSEVDSRLRVLSVLFSGWIAALFFGFF